MGKAALLSEWQFPKNYLQAALPAAKGMNPLVLKGNLDDALEHSLQKDWTLDIQSLDI